MRKVLFTALALGLTTSAAVAEPLTSAVEAEPRQMSEAEMERTAAGLVDVGVVVPVNVVASTAIAAALGVLAEGTTAGAGSDAEVSEAVDVDQGSFGFGVD